MLPLVLLFWWLRLHSQAPDTRTAAKAGPQLRPSPETGGQ